MILIYFFSIELKWKAFSEKSAKKVENEGIFAGYYNDSTPVYAGRGYDYCTGQTPARINTRNFTQPPGVYTNCYNMEFQDSSPYAQYLVNDSSYTFTWVAGSSTQFYLNSVYWNDSLSGTANTFIMSRVPIYYNDHADDQFTTIAKTFFGQGSYYYNPLSLKTEQMLDDVDILICTTDGSTEPMIAQSSSCGKKCSFLYFK